MMLWNVQSLLGTNRNRQFPCARHPGASETACTHDFGPGASADSRPAPFLQGSIPVTALQHAQTTPPELAARLAGLATMIGRTPLLELHFTFRGRPRRIFGKYEQRSFTGSVKDRMAMWILRAAYDRGQLQPGDTIVEATSGNTGIAFAALGRALGHPVRIYMPDWMSRERVALIESFGAQIVPVSRDQGGFLGSIAMADQWAREHGRAFLPHQFANPANIEAHEATTGPEILCQLRAVGLAPDAFIAGVGTGGTVMGVGRALRRGFAGSGPCSACAVPNVRIHPLEPAESPTLRTGRKNGHHRIQGISDEFIPSILHLDELDEIVDVHDGDSILMAQALCRAGLAVGISSGANVLGALRVLEEIGDGVVVTILPDSNKKYLSTDLYRDEPVRDGYLSPHVDHIRWLGIACPGPEIIGLTECTCGFKDSCS
jgi:cysteine synthase